MHFGLVGYIYVYESIRGFFGLVPLILIRCESTKERGAEKDNLVHKFKR